MSNLSCRCNEMFTGPFCNQPRVVEWMPVPDDNQTTIGKSVISLISNV